MRNPFHSALLLPLLGALSLPVAGAHAQQMSDWSAIEVPAGSTSTVPPASAPARSGSAAADAPRVRAVPGHESQKPTQPVTGALERIARLKPVRFHSQPGQGDAVNQYGLLPADLAQVYPELLRTDLIKGTQTINTAQLTPILVQALKELLVQVQTLQSQQQQLAEAYARLSGGTALMPAVPAQIQDAGELAGTAASGRRPVLSGGWFRPRPARVLPPASFTQTPAPAVPASGNLAESNLD